MVRGRFWQWKERPPVSRKGGAGCGWVWSLKKKKGKARPPAAAARKIETEAVGLWRMVSSHEVYK